MESIIKDVNQEEIYANPTKDPSFWGICLGHAFTHWYPATFYILLPYMALQFGLSKTEAGLIVSIMYIVKSVVSMPLGTITDMTTRKNALMAISLSLAALPFLFMGMVNTYWLLLILVIIMGIGNQLWHPPSFSSLSNLYPHKRGFVFGLHGMSANLGDLLAPAAIGAVLTWYNWHQVVYLNFIPGLVVGLLIFLLMRKKSIKSGGHSQKGQESKASLEDYRKGFVELLKNRQILMISFASSIRSMSQTGLKTFLPIYLALTIHLSPIFVGLYVTVMELGGFIAGPIVGGVSDRFGRKRVLYTSLVLTSILTIVTVLIRQVWLLVVMIALLGFFIYSLRPVMQAWAMDKTDKNMAGTTTSLLFTMQSILAAITPLVGGILADQFGIQAAFYFIAVIILLGNIVVFLIPGTE